MMASSISKRAKIIWSGCLSLPRKTEMERNKGLQHFRRSTGKVIKGHLMWHYLAVLIPACASSSPAFLMMYSASRRRCSGRLPWILFSRRTASPVQPGPSARLWKTPLGTQNPPDVPQRGTPRQDHISEASLLFASVSGHQNVAWS